MKAKIYIVAVLLGIAMMGCTNLRPAEDTTIPPVETWSTLNVTVRLAGAGWDISGSTNVGLVLVPMTNTNSLAAFDIRYDWSNQTVYLNPSGSFSHTFSNISKNPAPAGAGKYGLFIFKDTNMNGSPEANAIGFTEPQPDGSTNIVIDGKSAYNVTFQKIRATFNITMLSTNDGKPYYLYTDKLPIDIGAYPLIGAFPNYLIPAIGTVPTDSGLSFSHILTFDYATNLYIACYIDITNNLTKNSNDMDGFYNTEVLGNKIAIMANITLVSPNIFSFDVTNAM
ncbi:MAG: hypothetical protein HPY53_12960 [Brevinematales bacterium]|nr:hypothetical protein [Brevinematales bacterium]